MDTIGIENYRLLGLDSVQGEQVYPQARTKRNTLKGRPDVFCAVKNLMLASYILHQQFGTVTNINLFVLGGGGAQVVEVVRIRGYVSGSPVACNPVFNTRTHNTVLTNVSMLRCE